MKKIITSLLCVFSVTCLSLALTFLEDKNKAIYVDIMGLTQPQKLEALAMQGLANRERPQVLLNFGKDNRWVQFDFDPEKADKEPHRLEWDPQVARSMKVKYPTIMEAWMDIFKSHWNYEFEAVDVETLFKRHANKVKGMIVYDDFESEVALVGTMAGLKDAIPVLRSDIPRFEAMLPGLNVVFDTQTIPTDKKAGRKVSVHRWMVENLLSEVDKKALISRDKTYGEESHDTYVDIDQAVQRKWLVYNLTHYRPDLVDEQHRNPKENRPLETEVLHQILSAYPSCTPVIGWGAVDENTLCRTLSEHRLVLIGSGIPNNSFFAGLKPKNSGFKQKKGHVDESTVKLENKVYITFMINEGDTIKNAIALQGFGGWIQPERGQIPINWGLNPLINVLYPGLMDYYYTNATKNDYFFSAAAGWGYAHPSHMDEGFARDYVKKVKFGGEIADTRYVDIWWPGNENIEKIFDEGIGMKGRTNWNSDRQFVDYNRPIPMIHSNHYYTLPQKTPKDFAEMLMKDYANTPKPWFVVVYGGTPYRFKGVMDHLPQETFKAVTLDEFFSAATVARKSVEGRVWIAGPNAPKGVAP